MGGSVQAMMRAAGFTNEKDFFKAVEEGKVLTKDVLPKFAEELKKMSRAGGALDKTMNSTPAQFQRFMNAVTDAKLVFYDNGMNEGLAYMFKEFTNILLDLKPLIRTLGQMFKGAFMSMTFVFKALAVPFQTIIKMFDNFGEVLESLGLKDYGGMLWTLVGASAGAGILALMAKKFGLVTMAVKILNSALLTTLARLAPFLAAYAAIEDVFLYMKYGDNANTVTGTVLSGGNSLGKLALNNPSALDNSNFLTKMVAGQFALFDTYKMAFNRPEKNIEITVNDSEFSKAIDVKFQSKSSVTQMETAQ